MAGVWFWEPDLVNKINLFTRLSTMHFCVISAQMLHVHILQLFCSGGEAGALEFEPHLVNRPQRTVAFKNCGCLDFLPVWFCKAALLAAMARLWGHCKSNVVVHCSSQHFKMILHRWKRCLRMCGLFCLCGKWTKLLAENYCLFPYCNSAQSPKSNILGKHTEHKASTCLASLSSVEK